MNTAADAKRRAGVAEHDAGVPCSLARRSARELFTSSHRLPGGAVSHRPRSSVALMAAQAIARRPAGSPGGAGDPLGDVH